tara:strand:- start:263 stop:775 length:513 start_codon:yes stop_codon:yes gene_type:complete
MGGIAPWIGLGASIFGGYTEQQAHHSQAGVYRQSAGIEDMNAKMHEARGKWNSAAILAHARQKIANAKLSANQYIAKQQSDYSASGVEFIGTASDVMEDQLRTFHNEFANIHDNAAMEAANVQWSSDIDAWNARAQADRYRYMAQQEDYAGDASMLGGVIGGIADFFDMF